MNPDWILEGDGDTGPGPLESMVLRLRELEETVTRQNEFIRQLTERVAICSELLAKRAVKCSTLEANNESQTGLSTT